MTNERAFEEFRFAVNQWFRHMDKETRQKAIEFAGMATDLPFGEVFHQEVVRKPVAGRGEHLRAFAGKVWMLNRSTGGRVRVNPDDVAEYVANGFERGGPRSK